MRTTTLNAALTVACCCSTASAFVPAKAPISNKLSISAAESDHGDHGDAFHFNDALDEMYTAVAGINPEKEDMLDPCDYEYDMLQSKAELDRLMHTKNFRHALDSDDAYDVPAAHDVATPDDLQDDDSITHFEFAALKKKKALDDVMSSKLQGSHDDDHSVHPFEQSLLESHSALDNLLDGGSFKESIDSDAELMEQLHEESLEKRVQIDDHMKGYPKAVDAVDPTSHHFEFASLKKKRALDDLMHSKGFRHNLDSEDYAALDDEPHFMSSVGKAKAALDAVMSGEAFRKSLESDATLGTVGDDVVHITKPLKTHNDIVSHFEFATLKKRAALDKLARNKELCM